jgi:hypothetical protein
MYIFYYLLHKTKYLGDLDVHHQNKYLLFINKYLLFIHAESNI